MGISISVPPLAALISILILPPDANPILFNQSSPSNVTPSLVNTPLPPSLNVIVRVGLTQTAYNSKTTLGIVVAPSPGEEDDELLSRSDVIFIFSERSYVLLPSAVNDQPVCIISVLVNLDVSVTVELDSPYVKV